MPLSPKFQSELQGLLNKHSVEGECDMPDFLLAEMLCQVIRAVGSPFKKTLDWHGTRSVCHPGPAENTGGDLNVACTRYRERLVADPLEPQTKGP